MFMLFAFGTLACRIALRIMEVVMLAYSCASIVSPANIFASW